MKDKPLVSVIVPIYNVEPYLDECVKSIISQTYDRLEIILVDDGSPDRCPEMADAWAKRDSRIVVIHKENGGPSSAKNVGLDQATGEFVTFIDGDDWIDVAYVESLAEAISVFQTDIAIAGFRRVFPDGKEIPSPVFLEGSQEMYVCPTDQAIKYFFEVAIAVWGKLYRRSSVGRFRFIDGRLAEEFHFQMELLKRSNRVAFCNRHLYDYRQRSNSIARSVKPGYLLDHILSLSEALKECEKYFPRESDFVRGWLASLVYEFTAAEAFGREEPDAEEVVALAINQCDGADGLLSCITKPEEIIFYTWIQFASFLTKEERKRLQRDYRSVFPSESVRRSGLWSLVRHFPAYVSLPLAEALKKALGGAV